MSSDPKCKKANADGQLRFENYVVTDGGLDNVFVYVKDGLGNYYFDTPAEPAAIDQQGCRYVPHVLGVRAGQPIEITNSDATCTTCMRCLIRQSASSTSRSTGRGRRT
jgi:hypothetical protein